MRQMLKIHRLLFIVVVFCNSFAYCQTNDQNNSRPALGKQVPDISFLVKQGDKIHNAKLSDYKNKLIIFDFWGVDCLSCFSEMPKMYSLQQKFADNIQVFEVTDANAADVQNTFERLRNHFTPEMLTAAQNLQFIVRDTTITKMFPHLNYGIKVWIDMNQIYQAIDYSTSTTENNVTHFFSTGQINFVSWKYPTIISKEQLDSDFNARLNWPKRSLFNSALTGFDDRVSPDLEYVLEKDSTGKIIGLGCFNMSLGELYRIAYSSDIDGKLVYSYDRIQQENPQFEKGDSIKYVHDDSEYDYDWLSKNSYCYLLKISSSANSDIFAFMRKDLDRFFNMVSVVEMATTKCWVLKPLKGLHRFNLNNNSSIHQKTGNGVRPEMEGGRNFYIFKNVPTSSLMNIIFSRYLRDKKLPTPFIDETGYKGTIMMKIPLEKVSDKYSIPALRKSLNEYGFDLVEEYRNVNLLTVRRKNLNDKNPNK